MGLFGGIKAILVRREINAAIAPFDTEEERQAMEDEQVKKGMSPMAAHALSAGVGLLYLAIQDVMTGGRFKDLLEDPKALGLAILAALLFRLAHAFQPPTKK